VPFVLDGHQDWISAATFSPDGRWLVTASWDGTARLWDVSSLLPGPARTGNTGLSTPDPAAGPFVLGGHQGPLGAATFSSDSHWLVTASGDGTARLWDLTTPNPAAEPFVLRGHEGAILDIAFSPDGRWLVTTSQDSTARLWDISALLPGPVGAGSTVQTASNPAAEPLVLGGHGFGVNTAVFSPDGRWLATASWEGIARLWDLSTLPNTGLSTPDPSVDSLLLFGHQFWISAMVFSPDSGWLVTAGVDNTARLWDLRAPDPSTAPFVLRGHQDWIIAAVFSPDNRWLVTASADSTARLWDLRAPDPSDAPLVLRGHRDWINVAAFSPDGRRLVTGSRDGSARLWDVSTLAPGPARTGNAGLTTPNSAPNPAAASLLLCGHGRAILAAAFSPETPNDTGSHWLATGSGDGSARLWPLGQDGLSDPARAEWEQSAPEHEYATIFCPEPSTEAS
jgi:WD40 repeat protein